jgi:hypothetical protein
VTVALGDTSKAAGDFGNTPLSQIDVAFRSLADNPGTTQDATKATSISCDTSPVSSVTNNNSLTTGNLKLNDTTVVCTVNFADSP